MALYDETKKHGYVVRLLTLPANDILNLLAPNEVVLEKRKEWYKTLEDSILEDGVRNPIMVNAGKCDDYLRGRLPKEWKQDHDLILVCCRYGGSRLFMAQKHDLEVTCLVSDYIGRYEDKQLIKYKEEVEDMYEPRLREVVITINGLWGKR